MKFRPLGPILPKEYPASDAVSGKLLVSNVTLAETANDELICEPIGKILIVIH
jgi:hypothetical protein